jgi:hypothetical protein
MKPLAALLLTILLAACTSSAYVRHKTPSISGNIRIAGEPAVDIPVYLSLKGGDTSCLNASAQTRTGPQGEFNLPGAKDHMSYTPLMTHYLDEWVVCADIDGQRVMLYADNRYGMGSVGGAVSLQCGFEKGQYSAEHCSRGQ